MGLRPLLIAVLAGCLAAPPPDEAAPLEVDASLHGCREAGVAKLVTFDHARSLLPAGFEPREAADFLGMPAPTGGALILAGELQCDHAVLEDAPQAWADLLVLVDQPAVAGVELQEDYFDLYQLAHFTTGPRTLALLDSVGFAAVDAEVQVRFPGDPVPALAAAAVSDAQGPLLDFAVATGTPQPYQLVARFWHEADEGLAYFDHVRTPITMHAGALARCEVRAGSPQAAAFGDGCMDALGGIFAEPSDFRSTFHFLPGAHVEPAATP